MIIDPTKNFYKNYVLCNGGPRLFRFVNTNFGSKWAGLWDFDKKLLDYWAFRVNGTWLSMDNCSEFEHRLWCASHRHKVGELLVTEDVVPAKDVFMSILRIKNSSTEKNRIEIAMEVGVNLRLRSVNLHNQKYGLRTVRSLVEVSNETGLLVFGSLRGKFVKKDEYGEHFPGKYAEYCGYVVGGGLKGSWNEDLQSKYVPGEYTVQLSLGPGEEAEIPFFFSGKPIRGCRKYSDWIDDSRKDYERLREQYGSLEIAEALDKTLASIRTFEVGEGFAAGHPFFNEVWVRDACWCLPAYLCLGMHGHVKKFLNKVGSEIKNGKVPSLINSEKCLYDSADAAPLWVIGLYDYLDFTGDKKMAKSLSKKIKEVLDYGKTKLQENLVEGTGYTWMDSLERKKAIELQALWCRAFYCGGMILYTINGNLNEYIEISSKMLKQIDSNYWGGMPRDNLGSDFKSPNFLFQLALMHIPKDVSRQLSQIMSKDYLTPVGIRTRHPSDKGYDPKGYHTGSVWPFLTLTAAMAHSNYERTDEARRLLETNWGNFDKQCICGINEFFEADTMAPRGCTCQAWSMAGALPVLDNYVLGIRPKLTEKLIILDPSKFYFRSFERRIKIGKSKVAITYSRKGKTLEVSVSKLPAKAKIPNFYSKFLVNGKETMEKVVTLQPGKKYCLKMEF